MPQRQPALGHADNHETVPFDWNNLFVCEVALPASQWD
jgi:hypothetical protein